MKDTEKYNILLEKAKSYCAYQERCVFDLNKKFREWEAEAAMKEKIIIELKKEDFVDEMRFARVFAGGKFRIKKWGRNKIRAELRKKNIPDHKIESGLLEIDENEYLTSLKKLIDKKKSEFLDPEKFNNKNKIFTFVFNKGYEKELILKLI